MKYGQPTSLPQKIHKLLQLFAMFFRIRSRPAVRTPAQCALSVLMVVPQIDRMGGYEKQALQLAGSLTLGGNFVTILSDQTGNFPPKEFRNGFLICRIPARGPRTKWNLFLSTAGFFWKKRKTFQIVHGHGITGLSLFGARAAKLAGRPVVLKPATSEDISRIFSQHDLKHRIYQRWLKLVGFIAISQQLKDELKTCGIPESRIDAISNFVDTLKFEIPTHDRKNALRSKFSAGSQTLFLFLGRLEKRKGVDFLLRAWKKAAPGILWIVGSGPEERALKQLSSELGLQNVSFHGPTQTPLDFYQAADVFVFPSLKEGSPNVMLEAMSCGLPCIATRIGGIVDLMNDGSEGLLVEPGSASALAEAINRAGTNLEDRKQWSYQAAKTARERFDISLITARYLRLYSDLISEYR